MSEKYTIKAQMSLFNNGNRFEVDDGVTLDRTSDPATLVIERAGSTILSVNLTGTNLAGTNQRWSFHRGSGNDQPSDQYEGKIERFEYFNADDAYVYMMVEIGWKAKPGHSDDDAEVFVATKTGNW